MGTLPATEKRIKRRVHDKVAHLQLSAMLLFQLDVSRHDSAECENQISTKQPQEKSQEIPDSTSHITFKDTNLMRTIFYM